MDNLNRDIFLLGFLGIKYPIESIASTNLLVDHGAASKLYFSKDDNRLFTNILYFCSKGYLHWKISLTWFMINSESPINLTFLNFNFMMVFIAKIKASYSTLLFVNENLSLK